MISAYLARPTWLHRVPAGAKLIAVAAISIAVLPVSDWRLLMLGLCVVLSIYGTLGREALMHVTALKPLVPILVGIGLLQVWADSWEAAAVSILRIVLMVLAADLVTMTTTLRALMAAVEPVLRPLRLFGLDPERLSLAVALVLRFVPVLLALWQTREEAWRARSSRRRPLRLVANFVAETLVMADHVSESLDARGFSSREARRHKRRSAPAESSTDRRDRE
ncbi:MULTISPECIES: energy-coupling factor transporter transmembrane protein EcfT [unclassified Chelatococcus]|uniref:energy-coupling factor transporter transmembrane component T family protein n=1 Tax=unclassified Chelatococcus TaxID=2638111 RepID=UPI001BCDD3FA|nr:MULTISPECIES: energy-coupling factor transporter transmembrane protein EcfT [unclassified Chelatococcus]CAH1653896.1 Transmembrane component BioN of energizing module of biotin ECF transporter [Hyphomicrobiales bacterium]MBS7740176.1 energy-coupling factor transporter transmembrane protein EcfT [Chelatococcus sp. HY11]MBX3544995.1 energy-coupling factor transporter transmembrane protein EcfT [Chelatococcus sp.]MCO5079927.1 energy-coupling factor transporter transmembrane protein EcfT [Chelat